MSNEGPARPINMATMKFSRLLEAVVSAVQVSEYEGEYSVDRVMLLARYKRSTNGFTLLLPMALTPLPALISIVVTDWVPLSPPQAGLRANSVLWVRTFIVACLMLATLLLQLSVFAPRLRMKNHEITAVTLLTSISATACAYGFANVVGFPIPFTITTTAPLSMTCFSFFSALCWGRLIRLDSDLRAKIVEYVVFMCSQFGITLVYPVLAYAFICADSVALETFIACLLPLVKWLFRRMLSYTLRNLPESRSPFTIFSIDVFHALFIACCLQNASSWVTTGTIVAMDFAFMLMKFRRLSLKLTGIYGMLDNARIVRGDQPPFPSPHSLDLLDCVMFLLRASDATSTPSSHVTTLNTTRTLTQVAPSPPTAAVVQSKHGSTKAQAPAREPAPCFLSADDMHFLSSLDAQRKAELTTAILQLLDFLEYSALAEYIEVVLPAVYAAYLAVVYELPNRVYYPQLRSLTPAFHIQAIHSVLVYVAFELASFAILECVVRLKARLSPLRQLSFVLHRHGWILPWELVFWVSFVVQCALEHYGNDYTFKFTWLRTSSSSPGG